MPKLCVVNVGDEEKAEEEMARLDVEIAKAQETLRDLNAQKRAWRERLRSIAVSKARVVTRLKKQDVKAEKDKNPKGRCRRAPGRCRACIMRFLKEVGGPAHNRALCFATQAEIAKEPESVRQRFRK